MKTIAFFGHRLIFDTNSVKEKLAQTPNEMIKQGFTTLLVGCHGDFDSLALQVATNYKKHINKNLKIKVVLTSLSSINKGTYGYSKADIFNDLNCETMFYDIEEVYFKNRITYSNKKMVDDSDLIICYVDMNSSNSGAKSAIKYAIQKNKRIINLYD